MKGLSIFIQTFSMKHISTFAFIFLVFSNVFSQTWVKVSAGTEYSLALKSDGTLWAWGANNYGQLGVSSPSSSNVPVQVGSDSDWKDIACGSFHILAMKADSTLWSWGFNASGQLGLGNTTNIVAPQQIGSDHDWVQIECGTVNSAAIKANGTLWMWGNNLYGQCGIGTTTDVLIPTQVGSANTWKTISLGGLHALGIQEEASQHVLYAWGFNSTGQLGLGTTTDVNVPTAVLMPVGQVLDWKSISAGFQFSSAVAQNGTAWTWGFNGNGQLGLGDTQDRDVITQLGNLTNWNQITAGSSFAYGTLTDATQFSWGFNGFGMLSIGTMQSQNTPYPLTLLSTNINSIALAEGAPSGNQLYGMHVLALSNDSLSICTVGANYTGQLGIGTTSSRNYFECDVEPITGIDEKPSIELSLYPNPTTGKFTLEAPFEAGQQVQIFNVNGQQVYSHEILNASIQLSFEMNLPQGLYLLKLINQEGSQIGSSRLVVE